MPLLALAVLFILVPLAELYVIYKVGDAIGIWPTIALLAADSLLGSVLLRTQGRTVWRRFNEALAQGKVPHREVIDGVLVVFGGAFLITPGFLTDIAGLLLLLPPTRSLVRGVVAKRLGRRVVVGVTGRGNGSSRPRPGSDYDVEGSAREYEGPPRGLEG